MSEHLSPKAIAQYKRATLSPLELLGADDHLAVCRECRQKIKQNQNSALLYKSFYEPLQQFAAGKQNVGAMRAAQQKAFERLKNFRLALSGIAWQPQTALVLIAVAVFGGLLIARFGFEPRARQTAAASQPGEENPAAVFLEELSAEPRAQRFVEIARTVNPKIDSDRLAPIGKTKTVKSSKQPQPTAATAKTIKSDEPKQRRIRIEIDSLETDNSQTLSAAAAAPANPEFSTAVRVVKTNNFFEINFAAADGAAEYEMYLVEVPKFQTVSREKVKLPKWTLPSRKMKTGLDYVLQITALKNNQPIGIVKKTVRVATASKP